MSRTIHHRAYYKRSPEQAWDYGTELVPYTWCGKHWLTGEYIERESTYRVDIAGARKKVKRTARHPNHWAQATPGWWVHDFMTVPKRAACRNWEKDVVKHHDLEEITDCPDYGRRPHVYYW